MLDQVRAIIPPAMVITLLADRGFVHERLLHYLNQQRWHFRLRLPGDTLVHLSAQHVSAVKELCPPAGRDRFLHGVSQSTMIYNQGQHHPLARSQKP